MSASVAMRMVWGESSGRSGLVVGAEGDQLAEEISALPGGIAVYLHQIAEGDHADQTPTLYDWEVPAVDRVHLCQSTRHLFGWVTDDQVSRHDAANDGRLRVEPCCDDAGHEVALGEDASQLAGVEDGDRAYVPTSHPPCHVTDSLSGLGVIERTSCDQFADPSHDAVLSCVPGIVLGLRVSAPRPS